jgi:uncharacterized protein (TIGR02231 family)
VVELEAPIVAVTVYPDAARVTRRAQAQLDTGEQRILLGPLPQMINTESVRVAGSGPATILGVATSLRHRPRQDDPRVAELTASARDLESQLASLGDQAEAMEHRLTFLDRLAQRAGTGYARAISAGEQEADAAFGFADSLTDQLVQTKARQRAAHRLRDDFAEELQAIQRALAELPHQHAPDQNYVEVRLDVTGDDAIELDLTYEVYGVGWESTYDFRLDGDTLAVTWYGEVSQHTGEDWPECELRLSTARASGRVGIPKLDPWYLARWTPPAPPQPMPKMARASMVGGAAPAAAPMMMEVAVATMEVSDTVAAAVYRPAMPVAIAGDGSAEQVTLAAFDLPAQVDYVTAPVQSTDAFLRATVVNGSQHTLRAGTASLFHGGEFVSRTELSTWAPGEERELALGLSERVRVERELVKRAVSKATLGSTRRVDLEYRTTITNHTGRDAAVTVLDQIPVGRDETIKVTDVRLAPDPAERDDLGEVTWSLKLAPDAKAELTLAFRVEHPRDATVTGWRE